MPLSVPTLINSVFRKHSWQGLEGDCRVILGFKLGVLSVCLSGPSDFSFYEDGFGVLGIDGL